MKLNLVYAERSDKWDELINSAVKSILGVNVASKTFDGLLTQEGVAISWVTQYKRNVGLWFDKEPYWSGVKLFLTFNNADYCNVRRSLLIKTDGILDEAKLRQKWAEILALKAEDDERKERKGKAEQRRKDTLQAAKDAIKALGIDDNYLMGLEPSSDGTVSVTIRGLSVEAVAQIAAIVQQDKKEKV